MFVLIVLVFNKNICIILLLFVYQILHSKCRPSKGITDSLMVLLSIVQTVFILL